MQWSVSVYWVDKLSTRAGVEQDLLHRVKPNHSAAQLKPLSKVHCNVLLFSPKKSLHMSYVDFLALMCLVPWRWSLFGCYFTCKLGLTGHGLYLKCWVVSFSPWDEPSALLWFSIFNCRPSLGQLHSSVFLWHSNPQPTQRLCIKNLKFDCLGKRYLFLHQQSISFVGNILKYLGWYFWSSCGSLWQWTWWDQDTLLVAEIVELYSEWRSRALNKLLCRFS